MAGYRRAAMISDVSSSRIASLAVGEVRVSGVVEAAELSLVSPLQSASCVYYRGRITETRNRDRHTLFNEERAVGFRVRDTTGTVRIFPRGARWDVRWRPDEHDGALATGAGLLHRTGTARAPPLVAGATAAPIVAETAERASRAFDIPPDELVLATSQDEVLLIAQGAPGTAEERNQRQFLVGLLGALLSVGAAVALAVELSTTARP